MDTIHTILLIPIFIIRVLIIMVLDMVIIIHTTETITTTIIITTTIVIMETLATLIMLEEPEVPTINLQALPEHHNHKTRLPLEPITIVEIPGTMVEILIEELQVVAVALAVPLVAAQAVVAPLEEIAIEDLLAVLAVHEEDK
jgi:hypothetical protein